MPYIRTTVSKALTDENKEKLPELLKKGLQKKSNSPKTVMPDEYKKINLEEFKF